MEKGLTAQLTNRVTATPRQCRVTPFNARRSILSSMGMIISQIITATGRLIRATSSRPTNWKTSGTHCPRPMPAPMHRNTQTLR